MANKGRAPRGAGRAGETGGVRFGAGGKNGLSAPGSVALIGGGPGPADLLTLRAWRLLMAADVVVTDRLGPTEVLSELDPSVEIVRAGKAPGRHTLTQTEINEVIVERALAGHRVVRLKGGDPFVFGRGGEEVTACLAAGVPVEVVPGVTSAIAVPSAAGIPVTHRGTATSLHVINGTAGLNEAALAALRDRSATTVVLMGVAAFSGLAAEALAGGAAPDLPVAFIERGCSDAQRTVRSTLEGAADAARAADVVNPAVIVLGEVAGADLLLPALATASSGAGAGTDDEETV